MKNMYTKEQIRERFRRVIDDNKLILITGGGIGISAKFAEFAGSDMTLVSYGSYLRMDGQSTVASLLPYGNANDTVAKLVARISPAIQNIPMAAGVCGTDPTTDMRSYLKKLKYLGFAAIVNSPTVGILEGSLRKELEHAGLGIGAEAEMLKLASDMGFYTIGIAHDKEEARILCAAGIDALVCDMGFTVGGYSGALESQAISLECAVDKIKEMMEYVQVEYPDVLIFMHGGPILTEKDVDYIIQKVPVVGLLAESIVERIPVETPLIEAVKQFKEIDIEK